MTTNQIKFYKVQTLPTSLVVGAVYFEVTTQTIYVAKSASEADKFGVGLKNATLVDGVLTIERHDGSNVTVDFNDIASATSVANALKAINDKIDVINGEADGSIKAAVAAEAALREQADNALSERIAKFESGDTSVSASIANAIAELDATVGSQSVADGKHVAVEIVETDGKLTAVTVTESDIASAEALTEEINRATGVENELRGLIASAASGATTEVKAADGETKIVVSEEEGASKQKIFVISGNDIASATDLQNEITNRGTAEEAILERIAALDSTNDESKGRVTLLEEKVEALNSATHFEGVVEFNPSAEGATTEGYESGDIVIYGNKEYIFDGNAWIELGDTTAELGRISDLEAKVGSDTVQNQIATAIEALSDEDKVGEGNVIKVTVSQSNGNVTGVVVDDAALKSTLDGLDTTYVKSDVYNADKQTYETAHNLINGIFTDQVGLNDEFAVSYTDANYISEAQTMVAADMALDAAIKSVADRVKAEEEKAVVTSVTGNDDIIANPSTGEVSLSLNKAEAIEQNNNKVVTSGMVYDALCWMEFE